MQVQLDWNPEHLAAKQRDVPGEGPRQLSDWQCCACWRAWCKTVLHRPAAIKTNVSLKMHAPMPQPARPDWKSLHDSIMPSTPCADNEAPAEPAPCMRQCQPSGGARRRGVRHGQPSERSAKPCGRQSGWRHQRRVACRETWRAVQHTFERARGNECIRSRLGAQSSRRGRAPVSRWRLPSRHVPKRRNAQGLGQARCQAHP